ncbi:MAG: hypothetical protein HY017_10500 [Betaproteobacteria bacterium]|nr:hypothetical protein [Betaproteobacteria bacterium]
MPIDIVQQAAIRTDGTTVAVIGINLAQAPVPDRRYIAEVGSVNYSDDDIKLLFGQRKISWGSTLRSLVVIHMSSRAVRQFLRSVKGLKEPSLSEIMDKLGIRREAVEGSLGEEPEQTVAFAANVVAVAISGREACLDFYHISSFAMAAAAHSAKIPIDPVVRVDLRTGLFEALIGALYKIEADFPHDAEEEITV